MNFGRIKYMKVICVLLRKSRRIKKELAFVSARYIRILEGLPSTKDSLKTKNFGCFEKFGVFHKKRPENTFKSLRFLSFRYSADLTVSVLLVHFKKIQGVCKL